ncbi:MAG: hypothetical protein K9H61_01760 [Bacteroidia bacterium]|nr:hypothetical protein [Bacteroidia bacterium]MCF8445696.1 hypothetical protein [Bacteroidia bacterium]
MKQLFAPMVILLTCSCFFSCKKDSTTKTENPVIEDSLYSKFYSGLIDGSTIIQEDAAGNLIIVNRSSILKFNKNLELITEKAVSFNLNYKFVYPYIVYSSGLKKNKFSIFDVNNLDVEIKKDLNEFLGYSDTSATLLDFDFFKNGNMGAIGLFKVAGKNNPSNFTNFFVSFNSNSYTPNGPPKIISNKISWTENNSFREFNSKFISANYNFFIVFDPNTSKMDSVSFNFPIEIRDFTELGGEMFGLTTYTKEPNGNNLGIYKINPDFTSSIYYSFPTKVNFYDYVQKQNLLGDGDSLLYFSDYDGYQYWNKNTNEIRVINPKIFVPLNAKYGFFIYQNKFCYFTLHGLYYCKGNYKN